MAEQLGRAVGVDGRGHRPRPAVDYRHDIDGVRALAIVIVVAFHAHVPGFGGGFVGVDVFFVVSGWLITAQLLDASEERSARLLRQFWGRRIRRLVPASALMIATTLVLSVLFLSPLDWSLIAQRAVAAATYTSNLLFAWRGGDYFSGPLETSPFLHTWSLGVEEQFYILWPLIVLCATRAFGQTSTRSQERRLVVAMAVIGGISFAINLKLTSEASSWAFFGLMSRAWEFAVAGLAVVAIRGRSAFAPRLRQFGAFAGVAGIVLAVVLFDASTPYPGTAAVLPVVGTLALLLAGHGITGSHAHPLPVLRAKPLGYLGQLSYSWYLWHWPLMVLLTGALYRDTVGLRVLAATVALGVAAITHHLVENPLRFSASLKNSLARTYALGAATTLACIVLAVGLAGYTDRQLERSPYREYHAARESYHQYECDEVSSDGVEYCVAGAASGPTVLLIGDSHAGQWMSAFSTVGGELGLRVGLRALGNCSATPLLDQDASEIAADQASCAEFQEETSRLISDLRPSAVVLSDATRSRDLTFLNDAAEWGAALEVQLSALADEGIPVGLVVDNPLSNDPILCLARGRSEDFCTPSRDEALAELERFAPEMGAALETTDRREPVLDVNDDVCGETACRIHDGEVWIFGSFEHFTGDFTEAQEEEVQVFVEALLDEASRPISTG